MKIEQFIQTKYLRTCILNHVAARKLVKFLERVPDKRQVLLHRYGLIKLHSFSALREDEKDLRTCILNHVAARKLVEFLERVPDKRQVLLHRHGFIKLHPL